MKQKIYEPVREFERQTSYCPLYLAWRIVDEARDYFRTEIPDSYARKLAQRAEAVFAKHALSSAKWRRGTGRGGASSTAPLSGSLPVGRGERERSIWWHRFQNREFILKFMRHWLAGVLARENPVLYRQLPESFKIGKPLPSSDLRPAEPRLGISPIRWAKDTPAKPRSSGCESAPSSQSRFTSAATNSRTGSRGRSPHHRFVHGCELLTV